MPLLEKLKIKQIKHLINLKIMSENFESKFGNIDDLLNEVEQSTNGKKLLAEIDDLCGEIDIGIETRKQEVGGWPLERK